MTVNELRVMTSFYLDTCPEPAGMPLTIERVTEIAEGVANAIKSPRDANSGLATGRSFPITKQLIRSWVTNMLDDAMSQVPGDLTDDQVILIANTVSNVLKTKHDTPKAAIGNIR